MMKIDIVNFRWILTPKDHISCIINKYLCKCSSPASASDYYCFHMTHLTSFSCYDPDGRSFKSKGFSEPVFNEPFIAEMKQLRIIDK